MELSEALDWAGRRQLGVLSTIRREMVAQRRLFAGVTPHRAVGIVR